MKRCVVCGEIVEDSVEVCPVCKAKKFEPVGSEKATFACEHVVGDGKVEDKEIMDGLQANFMGECTEVGMYLAMSRVADREGYPEIAEAFKRYALEEAEHAAKFAELRLPRRRTLNCARVQRRARATASLLSQKEQNSSVTMQFTIPFTKWQRTKQDTAQALRVF